MADNPEKRAICNRALAILVAGRTTNAGMLFTSIDDTEFADWTTVSEQSDSDKRLICSLYEDILKEVIEDLAPDFASRYADLGQYLKVDKEFGGWDYLFELPTDYLGLIKQCSEGKPERGFKCDVLHFRDYSHVVAGTDDQAYYCSTVHISVDDTDDGQPSDGDGNSNWTLYSTVGALGADWAAGVLYKTAETGMMLATNDLTDDDGESAYIKYLAYVQAGQSDEPEYYPGMFKKAFATRLAAEMALDSKDYERRRRLLEEYEGLAKTDYWKVQGRHEDRVPHVTVFESRTR